MSKENIALWVSRETHYAIKVAATKENKTIKQFLADEFNS